MLLMFQGPIVALLLAMSFASKYESDGSQEPFKWFIKLAPSRDFKPIIWINLHASLLQLVFACMCATIFPSLFSFLCQSSGYLSEFHANIGKLIISDRIESANANLSTFREQRHFTLLNRAFQLLVVGGAVHEPLAVHSRRVKQPVQEERYN